MVLMRTAALAGVVVAAVVALGGSPATAAPSLSAGCRALNEPSLDGTDGALCVPSNT
jgi:hypothetical protein